MRNIELAVLSEWYEPALKIRIQDSKRKLPPKLAKLPAHEVIALILLAARSFDQLCLLLNCSASVANLLIKSPVYEKFLIPKKSGGYREIDAPVGELKIIQRLLNTYLQSYFIAVKHPAAHGFVMSPDSKEAHPNLYKNAIPHVASSWVLNIDVKDFFHSISASRVYALFCSEYFRFDEESAAFLTLLCTYEARLPVGAPTSPVLSNFVLIALDKELANYADLHALRYTRYADDLTFSSLKPFDKSIQEDLKNIIQAHGLSINKNKIRVQFPHRQQVVTGLVVNRKVNINRKMVRQVRAMLHDWKVNGLPPAAWAHKVSGGAPSNKETYFVQKIRGYLQFIKQIRGKDDTVFKRLNAGFTELLVRDEGLLGQS